VPVFVSAAERSPLSGAANFYRIPGVSRGRRSVHAFGEARFNGFVDDGEISIAWHRIDGTGRAVEPETILVQDYTPWGDGIVRRSGNYNPCPIYDPVEGHLHLLFSRKRGDVTEGLELPPSASSRDPARVMSMHAMVSLDGDGAQWHDRVGGTRLDVPVPFNRAATIDGRLDSWKSFYPGPGHGICMPDGTLLAPGWVNEAAGFRSIILRYDRAARRWGVNGVLPIGNGEPSLAVASDGRLIVNARPITPGGRLVAFSSTNGATWDSIGNDDNLPDPSCFGTILSSERSGRPRVVLFANPANLTRRQDLEIKLSLDDHRTFPVARRLYPNLTDFVRESWDGKAIQPTAVTHSTAYSDLVQLDDDLFGLLLEQTVAITTGTPAPNKVMSFVRFNLSWVLGG
jgi:sialidase-1